MINRTDARPCAFHLFSALIACGIVLLILFGGRIFAIHLERRTIHATAPEHFWLKNQGLVLQRAALRTPNVLVLYGSSELIQRTPDAPGDFFSTAPTGFQVCPVGKAGTTSLVMLQKLGALGGKLRGRKIAISLSPSWFFTPVIDPYLYAGNFSLPAASEMIFGGALDFGLKRDIARRMLQFPATLEKSVLLQIAVAHFASARPWDRLVLSVIWPLGKLQNLILDLQDHFEALVYILHESTQIPHRAAQSIDWETLINKAGKQNMIPNEGRARDYRRIAGDAAFLARIDAAREWIDLDLLLRTLADLKARPLILSMPIEFYDASGVSPSVRQVYYDRMTDLVQRYHFPLVQFQNYDTDPTFLIPHQYHLTAKGWVFYNRALNDFFHGNGKYSSLEH